MHEHERLIAELQKKHAELTSRLAYRPCAPCAEKWAYTRTVIEDILRSAGYDI